MPENTVPQNNIKVDGCNNNLSGFNQGGVQQNVNINTNPPEPPIDQIVTTDTAGKLNPKIFLQRDDEINEVINLIRNDPQIKLQIRGIGGLGKTSLCCQLFWKYFNSDNEDIKHLGWISYTSDLKTSIKGKINSKDVTAEDTELYLHQAKKFFDSLKGNLLLFVDNADDITDEDIYFLNSCACRVVITARYEIEEFEEYSLPTFSTEICIELYRKLSKDKNDDDESAIREVVSLAGHHTQAICLLARTQKECGYTAQELLAKLKERGFTLDGVSAEISSGRLGDRFEATFFEHMMKLFDIAKIKDANQLRVLKLFSLLAPNHPLRRKTTNDWFNSNNIKKLIQRGWLNEYENGDVYIHPVIAQVVRNSSPTELKTAEKLINNMALALANCQSKGIIVQNKLLPHAVSVAEYFSYEENRTLLYLYNSIGIIYNELADYGNALAYHEKALAIKEKKLGSEHPITAGTYCNIANVYLVIGEYDKALEYYEKSKEIWEKKLGTEHPETAAIYSNMAIVYLYMGEYDKALVYYEKNKGISEKKLGVEHPDTAITYYNYGYFSKETGKLDDALEYAKKAQVIFEQKLGEHFRTAMTYNLLADIYLLKKDAPNANKFAEMARVIYEETIFTKHPHAAENFRTLAEIALAEDDLTKALTYAEKAKVIFESKLKENHHNNIKTYRVLADIYEKLNDTQKAMEYRAKAEK